MKGIFSDFCTPISSWSLFLSY